MDEVVRAFGLDWRLLTIQVVNFVLLLWVLQHFLYKPVLRMIEKRKREITAGVEAAAEADSRLQKFEEEKKTMLTQAVKEADSIMNTARASARAEEERMLAQAGERGEALLAQAKTEAVREREHALKEAEREVARLSVLAAEKVLRARS